MNEFTLVRKRYGTLAKNSNLIIPISLEPDGVEQNNIWPDRIHSQKNIRSPISGCKGKGIRKIEHYVQTLVF